MKSLYTLLLALTVSLVAAQKPKKPKAQSPAPDTVAAPAPAVDIAGFWKSAVGFESSFSMELIFHIQKLDTGYSATTQAPNFSTEKTPVTYVYFHHPNLKIRFPAAGAKSLTEYIEYQGELRGDRFVGTLKMSDYNLPMDLYRVSPDTVRRAQDPVPPLPYYTEEITFENPQDHTARAGVLVLPQKEGRFPAVILLSNLPTGRDEVRDGHSTFLVLADYLARNGIASLRFDYRAAADLAPGTPYEDTYQLPIGDAKSAVAYLRSRPEIDKDKIGLLEHGMGTIIAPSATAGSKDAAFVILLGGMGLSAYEYILDMSKTAAMTADPSGEYLASKIFQGQMKPYKIVKESTSQDQLKKDLQSLFKEQFQGVPDEALQGMGEGMTLEKLIAMSVKTYTMPAMQAFIKYDPAPILARVSCPVLALSGEKDMEIPPKNNLPAIQQAVQRGGNNKVTVKILPGLNHLLQPCESGQLAEYATIEQTFSPEALAEIGSWIKAQTQ